MASERHEEEQAEKAFTISDKRLFTKEGARRAPDAPSEAPAASPPPPPPRREAPRAAEPQRPEPQQRPDPGPGTHRDLPPADFTMLVNMLLTNAMVFLGQMPAPGSQQYMRNLPQAQH